MFDLIPLKNSLENVKGFYFDGINIGLKPENPDLSFIRSDELCEVSAVFTQNKFAAAPIVHFLEYEPNFKTNFILINSKNANAMTGKKGLEDVKEILSALKDKFAGIFNPIMSSTGVIGYRLDKQKFLSGFEKLDLNAKNANNTALGIMTTDRFKKEICFRVETDKNEPFCVAAIAKGAGMINPSMATMLCYILTDAKVPKADLDEIIQEAALHSFNKISVDGDTSTNDTLMILSNGASNSYHKEAFREAVLRITKHLALEMLRDGEGSSKVVAYEISGAKNDKEAEIVAKNLSNSLLVKTALNGEDPNWGRIASTIGASGVTCDELKLEIYYDDVLVFSQSHPELDQITEQKAIKVMKQNSFKIRCNLNINDGKFTAYGCDLGHGYVDINASYRS